MSQTSTTYRITLISVMIISGAINTLAYKFQNKQLVNEGPFYKSFFHPYMQAITMFFGEFLALGVFFITKKNNPEKYKMDMLEARSKGKQLNMNKFWLAVPALCDFITSTLQYIALNFISGSVYQMMRGGTIITTAIFARFFLKTQVQKHQIAGCAFAFIGVFVVGLSNMLFKGNNSTDASASLQIAGYILILASLVFNGFFFVFEQKLLNKYHLDPLEVVGYQGLFGLCGYFLLLPILSYAPCSLGVDVCVFNEEGFAFFERPWEYFAEAFSNGALLFFCILGIFSIATFNVAGVTVTKNINALARSIADVTRTILVWGIGLIITVTAGAKYPNYEWQLTNGIAIGIQFIGFIILVLGNLIYNQIVNLPGSRAKPTDQRQSLVSAAEAEDSNTMITS